MTTSLDYAPHMSKEWVTRAEAAEILDMSTQSVDRYVARGVLRSSKNEFTLRVLLSAEDVEKLREARKSAP